MSRKLYRLEDLRDNPLWTLVNRDVAFLRAVYCDGEGRIYTRNKRLITRTKSVVRVALRDVDRSDGSYWAVDKDTRLKLAPSRMDLTLMDWAKLYLVFHGQYVDRIRRISELRARLKEDIPMGSRRVVSDTLCIEHTSKGLSFLQGTFDKVDPLVVLADSDLRHLGQKLYRAHKTSLPLNVSFFFMELFQRLMQQQYPDAHVVRLPEVGVYVKNIGLIPQHLYREESVR